MPFTAQERGFSSCTCGKEELAACDIPWNVSRAAKFLGVSPQTVYVWVERKQIPHLRIMGGCERHFCVLFRQPFVDVISRDVISYLKLSGSRLSRRPSVVSACGYMRKPTGAPFDPGKATSWAKLYAIQFISQDPNSRARAFLTMSSSSCRFPGGSSSTTFRTSAGSTGTQPWSPR